MDYLGLEAATSGVLQKKLLLKISEISLENTCVGISFTVNIAKFLRTLILQNIYERLLLTFFKKTACSNYHSQTMKPCSPYLDLELMQYTFHDLIDKHSPLH